MVKHNSVLDNLFAALCDPTRRSILQMLRDRPLNVSEIAEPFATSLVAVSKHLKVLEKSQLIRREKIGRTHLFHLEAGTLQSAFEWLKTYQSFWDLQLTSLENYLNKISKKMGE
jgi:DNA-binding transcriptional ArsR family regulator